MITPADCSSFIVDSCVKEYLEDDSDSANKYLDFANADLTVEDSERAFINAISNAKRALHHRIDVIATYFGFEHYPSKKKTSPIRLIFVVIAESRLLAGCGKSRFAR
jgi:hypothetical protein